MALDSHKVGAYLLRLSQSRSALVCLLIGTALILAIRHSKTLARLALVGALCAPILLLTTQAFSSFSLSPLISKLRGRDMTFTGRTKHLGAYHRYDGGPFNRQRILELLGWKGRDSNKLGDGNSGSECSLRLLGHLFRWWDWVGLVFLYFMLLVCGKTDHKRPQRKSIPSR